jgi:CubicO group peptidase (beta-lactamase class C family)
MKIPTKIISVFLVLFFIGSNLYGQSNSTFSDMDSIMQRVLTDWDAAGCAVAVVKGDEVVYTRGFGYRDMENKLPVTEKTIFQIGSSTKAFTCALLGILKESDDLNFDDPISKHLPEVRFFEKDMADRLTIRDFTCHRSGLPRHDFSWYLNPCSRDSLVLRMEYLEPSADLRSVFQYNNWGFLLQGVIAEKITKKSWEDNIREQFFAPLEMRTANFALWEMDKNADKAKGYFAYKDSIHFMEYYKIEGMGPAGSICASASEMGNWLIAWLNDGKFKDKEVMSPSYIREAISSQMVNSGMPPGSVRPDLHFNNYGMGWFLSSYKGHYRVEHGGNINGFSANVCFFPTDDIGVVVLTNQDGSRVPAIVRNTIVDKMLELEPYDWHTDLYDAHKKQQELDVPKDSSGVIEGTRPSHPINDYTGVFSHPGYGDYRFELHKDSLFLITKEMNFWLRHKHYDVFKPTSIVPGIEADDDGQMAASFYTNLEGEINSVEIFGMEPSLGPLKFTRKVEAKPVDRAVLEGYTGTYSLMGTEIKISLRDDDMLMVFVPGQPEYETVSLGNHKFNLAGLEGYSIKFDRKDNEPATAVSFIQPNGTFKAMRKE